MAKFNIFGKELSLTYNMKCQFAYEETVNAPFQFEDLQFVKNRVALFIAILNANIPDNGITVEDILAASSDDVKAINNCIDSLLREWYKLPKEEEDKEHDSEDNSPKKD